MKKILTAALILIAIFFAHWCFATSAGFMGGGQTVTVGGASTLFTDDWEDNDIGDDWDFLNVTTFATSGSAPIGHGDYAAHHSSANAHGDYIRLDDDGGMGGVQNEYCVQFYIAWDEVTGWGSSKENRILQPSGDMLYVYSDSGGNLVRLQSYYYDDVGIKYSSAAVIAPAVDTWYEVKYYRKFSTGAGADNGVIKVWFGGDLEIDISGIDDDTKSLDEIRLGPISCQTVSSTLDIYWDDFTLKDGLF